jgi:PAS domain S-box-containing protein
LSAEPPVETGPKPLPEVHQSDERFRLLVEGVRDYAILGLDIGGHVTSWNSGAQHIKGYRSEEIIGRHFSTFYTPQDLASGLPDAELVIATAEGRFEGEGWRVRKDGSLFWANVVITALYDEHEKLCGFGKVTRDITERRAADQALRRAAEDLSAANDVLRAQAVELSDTRDLALRARQEAEDASRQKSVFLANMSHEIRTPMNAVIGMTGLLLDTTLDAEQREFVETVSSSGDFLLSIINDILDFSKIEADGLRLEHQSFNLSECIESSVDLVAAMASAKGLELLTSVDDRCPTHVFGDATRLRQVLVNLLSNAVKFTERGEVLFSMESEEDDGNDVRLRISVADTGIGIPIDRVDSLFDSFSQVDASTTRLYGGTGLGLAISKRLVEVMGGVIEVQSVTGVGSTFSFSIPFARGVAVAVPSLLRPAVAVRGRSALVVDDNSANRRIIRLQLEGWGMTVTEAASGAETLELINSGACFDVALLDMKMPGMTGRELAIRLRECPASQLLPLILLSSYGERWQPEQNLFSAVLTKPAKKGDLREGVRQAIAIGTASPPLIPRPNLPTPYPHDQLRVLLAEDNPINQRVAKLMLEKLGQHPDLVANGAEAAQAVSRVPYDLVLMDVQMPEMDGIQATRMIRANPAIERGLRIVALTANASVEDREACANAGMDNYLAKPLRLEDLEAELNRTLSQITESQ